MKDKTILVVDDDLGTSEMVTRCSRAKATPSR